MNSTTPTRPNVLATARTGNWWSSKLPPLLAVAFAQSLRHPSAAERTAVALTVVFLALCSVAWFAHALNDLCDIEDDARAGKANTMARAGLVQRVLLIAGVPAVGLWAVWSEPGISRSALVALAANLVVFALYSTPPIRLKGRAWWGALADASGAHAVPMCFVLLAMPGGVGTRASDMVFAASAVVSALALGLRGILSHQVADRSGDALARVRTLGTTLSVSTVRRLIVRVILPVEVVALVGLFATTMASAPSLVVVLVVFSLVELAKVRRAWTLPILESERAHERYVPVLNNDLYELWLPTALAVQLAITQPALTPIPLLLLACFGRAMGRRLDALRPLVQPDTSRPRFQAIEFGVGSVTRLRRAILRSRVRNTHSQDTLPANLAVIVVAPTWERNGINRNSMLLLHALTSRGLRVRLLLTETDTDLINVQPPQFDAPPTVPVDHLAVSRADGWGAHWGATVAYVRAHAPCVVFPTYDWRHAGVIPQLATTDAPPVYVVGTAESGDLIEVEQLTRLREYWDAVVLPETAPAERLVRARTIAKSRVVVIPRPVGFPSAFADALPGASTTPVYVCGTSFVGAEGELQAILQHERLAHTASSTIVLGSADNPERPLPPLGTLPSLGVRVSEWSPETHCTPTGSSILCRMPSAHLPRELLDAMAHGAIPVLLDEGHALHTMFRDGETCIVCALGDTDAIATALSMLQSDARRREAMSRAVRAAVAEWFPLWEQTTDAYCALFASMLSTRHRAMHNAVRRRGPMLPPPPTVGSISVFPVALPVSVPDVGAFPSDADVDAFLRLATPAVAERLNDTDRQPANRSNATSRSFWERHDAAASALYDGRLPLATTLIDAIADPTARRAADYDVAAVLLLQAGLAERVNALDRALDLWQQARARGASPYWTLFGEARALARLGRARDAQQIMSQALRYPDAERGGWQYALRLDMQLGDHEAAASKQAHIVLDEDALEIERLLAVPGMTWPSERLAVRDAARTLSSEGAVLDLGCFVGSLTAAMASGLQRHATTPNRVVNAFDNFIWDDHYMAPMWSDAFPSKRPESHESFRHFFDFWTAPWRSHILAHTIDLHEATWHEPIAMLSLDALKTPDMTRRILATFLPHLSAGAPVFHQDFCFAPTWWIHVYHYALREYFTVVDALPGASGVLFRLTHPIAAHDLAQALAVDMNHTAFIDDAFAHSRSIVDTIDRPLIAAAHVQYYLEQQPADADRRVADLRRVYGLT